MRTQRSWQHQALEEALVANEGLISSDRMTIQLTNPAENARLDEIIISYLWEGAKRGVLGSGLELWWGTTPNPEESITTKGNHRYTQRTLNAVLQDPERERRPGSSPPWYCRVEIEVHTHGYRLGQYCSLTFPESFSWERLQALIKEPELQGCPPELTWSRAYEGKNPEWDVSFTGGSGHSFMPADLDLAEQRDGKKMSHAIAGRENTLEWNAVLVVEVGRRATQLVQGHVRIAQAMDALAADWNSEKRFGTVHESVLAVFESW